MIRLFTSSRWLIATMVVTVLLFAVNARAQIITTIAGGIGDGHNADTFARFIQPVYLSADKKGNVYLVQSYYHQYMVRKIDSMGVVTSFAGNGQDGANGFGGLARNAAMIYPTGLCFDRKNNAYIAHNNSMVSKIDTNNILIRYAGSFVQGYSGDGSIAYNGELDQPGGLAVDTFGNVYIADLQNNRIRKVDTNGIITTFAGTGASGHSGDGGPASSATLDRPDRIDIDGAGNFYIEDNSSTGVRRINASGIIDSIPGVHGYGAIDSSGNIYSYSGYKLVKRNPSGVITVLAGTGTRGYSGDGGPATAAEIYSPSYIAVDNIGNIYLVDQYLVAGNYRVRKVSSSGLITTIAGNGLTLSGFAGDGEQGTLAEFGAPSGSIPESVFYYGLIVPSVASDNSGNVYVADPGNQRIRKISPSGIISTVAGNGTSGFTGDGGPATNAALDVPDGVAVDRLGNLYIADYGSQHIRKVNTSGIITTIAGGGYTGLGDGGPATSAVISAFGVAVDYVGNVYIADGDSQRIRKVDASTGIITTIAGNGMAGFSGDGGPGTLAQLNTPYNVAVDNRGTLYISDIFNGRIRKLDTSGNISTFAGNSLHAADYHESYLGDGGPATSALFVYPAGVITDQFNNVYIADMGIQTGSSYDSFASAYCRIRKVDRFGYVHTVAGNGRQGFSGEGVSATTAEMQFPSGVALDTLGNLYIADNSNYAVRKVCCMTNITDYPPVFTGGDSASLNMCIGTTSIPINSFLSVVDSSVSDTINWTINSLPVHGTLSGFTYAAVTTGGVIHPSSLSFTPDTGFSGVDTFSIKVSDGTDYSICTFYVNVTAMPTGGTITAPSALCPGDTVILAESVPGGIWSSLYGHISISSAGVLTAVSAGSDTIVYTVTNICGTASIRKGITVYPVPHAGTISGSSTICVSSSTALSSSVVGGTWSSFSSFVAVDGGTGSISGVATGSALISYTVSNSCGSATDTFSITVTPSVSAGTISGGSSLCIGASSTFTSSSTGGTWSSSDASIASISSGGIVTGISSGAALISYTVTSSCGTSVAIALVNITATSSIHEITGASSVCTGSTTTLSDATSGGTWSSSTPSVASVNSSGMVTGIAAGAATISYSVSAGCGVSIATFNFTVNTSPTAGTISGASSLCIGLSSLLSTTVTGGSWASSATSIATISGTGVISPLTSGSVTFTYTVTNSCGSASTTYSLSVYPTPVVGHITGGATVCAGSSLTLSDSISGGTWSSGSPGIASVNSSGVVSGLSAGTTNISYEVTTGCGTATEIISFTVTAASAGTITGSASLCPGATSSLASSVSGGTWSSSATSVATVSSSGLVSGVSTGTTIISYATSGTCGSAISTFTITVESLPSIMPISGTTTLCAGTTSSLTDATTGGSWSSGTTSVATISGSGVVHGISGGTTIITYSVSSTCGSSEVTTTITVEAAPASAGTISGSTSLCAGTNITLSSSVSGGSWSSSNTAIATANAADGVISGVSAGSATISYTITNSCGSAIATYSISVNPSSSAGSITGASSLCTGTTTAFTESASGGTWSSSNSSVASIDASSGMVTGVSTGSAVITYSVSSSCGTATAIHTISVYAAPVAGTITGTSAICTGSSSTLSASASGGTWSSSATSIASVNSSGVVSGIAGGTAVISYTVTTGCGSASATLSFTVNAASAGTITGVSTLCTGGSATLSSTVSGGTWTSSTSSVATISSGGTVSAISAGTTIISYSVSGTCGSAVSTLTFTVGSAPVIDEIGGATTICVGSTTTVTDGTTGGTWSSGSTGIATISSSGVVRGVSAGTVTLSYTLTAGCGSASATESFIVQAAPSAGAISGASTICSGTTSTLSETISGGTWSSGTPGVASINSSGVVTGVSTGTATITYSVTNTCGTISATLPVTIHTVPGPGSITGLPDICAGLTTSLYDTALGGAWSSSDPSVATINSSGMVTGLHAGTITISYLVSNSCGSAVATLPVTIYPTPVVGAISGITTIPIGETSTLADAVSGGTWSSSNLSVATIGTTGIVTGVSTGTATITYTIINTYGCSIDTTIAVTVTLPSGISEISSKAGFTLFPNPSTSEVEISWTNITGPEATFRLTDVVGRTALQQNIWLSQTTGKAKLDLSSMAAGVYMYVIRSGSEVYNGKLIVE